MGGVIYLSGGIIPCQPSDEASGFGAASPRHRSRRERRPASHTCHTTGGAPVIQTPRAPPLLSGGARGTLNPSIVGRRSSPSIPGTRLELVRPEGRGILSPLRLPIPPPGRATPTQCSRVGGAAQRERGPVRAKLTAADVARRARPLPCAAGAAAEGFRGVGEARPECRNISPAV